MGQCENKALPEDFWENQHRYDECLREELDLTKSENYLADLQNPDKKWEQAQKNCEHLLVDYGRKFDFSDGEAMASSLETGIASVLTCNRFHIGYQKAAYFFEATYDCARNPVYNDYNEERYPSSLNIRMYYDGEKKELVKEWTVNSPTYSWNSLTNRMFEQQGDVLGYNPALMRQDVPITNILDAFEKVPITCTIKPDKDPVSYNSEMTIEISGFKDKEGRQSREFNRVLVVVESGSITNGARPESMNMDSAAVFQVGNGRIKVDYKAPDTSIHEYEQIKVYHCHNILKKSALPLAQTNISPKVIAQKKVMFKLPGVTAILSVEMKSSRNEDNVISDRNEVHKHWNEEQAATILFQLEKEPRLSKDVDPTTGKLVVKRYRYGIKHLSLINMTHTGSGTTDTDISGVHVLTDSSLTAGQATVSLEQPGSMLKMDVDQTTGKISNVFFPNVVLQYQTTLQIQGTKKTKEYTYPINRSSDTEVNWHIAQDFGDDGSGICYQVLESDGLTGFVGGSEKIESGRYKKAQFSSSWSISIHPDE